LEKNFYYHRKQSVQNAGEAIFSRLVKQFSEKEGVTEALFFGKSNAVGAEDEQQMAAFPFQAVFNK